MADENDDEYHVPLADQKVFGAGLRRKKVKFVSPTTTDPTVPAAPKARAGDRYLAIVLGHNSSSGNPNEEQLEERQPAGMESASDNAKHTLCAICRLPVTSSGEGLEVANSKTHESSLAHQVCLSHSHPPSHLDRNRQGLKYLSAYGWDPEAREGLGVTGSGIRAPIKPKLKNDTLGIGLVAPSSSNKAIKQAAKLDAKKTRKDEAQAQKDREKLRQMFYQHEDVDKYLGLNR